MTVVIKIRLFCKFHSIAAVSLFCVPLSPQHWEHCLFHCKCSICIYSMNQLDILVGDNRNPIQAKRQKKFGQGIFLSEQRETVSRPQVGLMLKIINKLSCTDTDQSVWILILAGRSWLRLCWLLICPGFRNGWKYLDTGSTVPVSWFFFICLFYLVPLFPSH